MAKPRKNLSSETGLFDRVGWLSECSDALRYWFAENGRWLEVPAKTPLFRDGDETDGMYGIGAGAVDLEFAPADLDNMVTLRIQPGGWVGHGSLVPNMPRPFNLVTSVDSAVYFVPAQAIRRILKEKPEFWPEFYAFTINQILSLMAFIGEAQSLPPEVRLARQLLSLSPVSSAVKLRQSDLAATLGMSMSSIRRALKVLVDAGMVETGYNRVNILDRWQLETMSRKLY